MDELLIRATEPEIADSLTQLPAGSLSHWTIRKLALERHLLREGLKEIASHSVCCDARHAAERLLVGQPARLAGDS